MIQNKSSRILILRMKKSSNKLKISLCDRMDIIRNLDEAVLNALEKDEEIEEEISEVGRFSERILDLILEIENMLSL